MTAIGRKQTVVYTYFPRFERPLLVKADVRLIPVRWSLGSTRLLPDITNTPSSLTNRLAMVRRAEDRAQWFR